MRSLFKIMVVGLNMLSWVNVYAECIGVVTAGGGQNYWGHVERGAHQAGKELGIGIYTRGPSDAENELGQEYILNYMVESGCRGIVLAANSLDLKEKVAQLRTQGVPTVYIDRDIGGQRISVVKTNNFSAGELAGREMVKALKGKGSVAVFREKKNYEPTYSRENGFIKAAVKGGLDVVVDVVVGSRVGKVRENVANILKNRTDIDGVFTPNESITLGALVYLKRVSLAGKIIHIGFDSNKYMINDLESNMLHGFIVQDPYKMGYLGVNLVYQAMNGESVKTDIETGIVFVSKNNINQSRIKKLLGLDETKVAAPVLLPDSAPRTPGVTVGLF